SRQDGVCQGGRAGKGTARLVARAQRAGSAAKKNLGEGFVGARFVRSLAAPAVAVCCLALPALADDYPSRPIRVITNTSAGGLSPIFPRPGRRGLHPRLRPPP